MEVQHRLPPQYQTKMTNKKGMSGLAWFLTILIVLVLITLGVMAYFIISGDGSSVLNGGSSIPSPPALPSG